MKKPFHWMSQIKISFSEERQNKDKTLERQNIKRQNIKKAKYNIDKTIESQNIRKTKH